MPNNREPRQNSRGLNTCGVAVAAFSCCMQPILRGDQNLAVLSRSRVCVYATASRSGLGCALPRGAFCGKLTVFRLVTHRPDVYPRTACYQILESVWFPITDRTTPPRLFFPDLGCATSVFCTYYVPGMLHLFPCPTVGCTMKILSPNLNLVFLHHKRRIPGV